LPCIFGQNRVCYRKTKGAVHLNSRQLQYAVILSQAESFSLAAEQLNITQPALSKQILALEKELGVELFDRGGKTVTLTAAGRDFIRQAKQLLQQEENLLRSMAHFQSGEAATLTIGISPFRSLYLVDPVVKQLKQRFPQVQVKLREAGTEALHKEAAEGKYDFAIVNLPVDETVLDAIPLEPDKLVLAVPNSLLDRVEGSFRGALPRMDLSRCPTLPFVVVGQGQQMRTLFDKLCAKACVAPPIAMEVVGIATAWRMVCAGIGAGLFPLQFVEGSRQDVTLFSLKNAVSTRRPAVVYPRGQYLSPCARYAIELLTQK